MTEHTERAREIIARALSLTAAGKSLDELDEWWLARMHEHADSILADLGKRGLCIEEGWQPIESAPKNGTCILIGREGDDVGARTVEITEWCVSERSHFEHVEGDLYRKVADEPYEFWNGNGHRATHWRPMPAAPK